MNKGSHEEKKQREPQLRTRWERMKKDELSLDNLLGLLGNTKLAEGKSPQAVEWYKSTMRGYMRWLESQGLPTTLEHFTLENVRAYIVHYVQERPAFV